jgi:hypothetical protein
MKEGYSSYWAEDKNKIAEILMSESYSATDILAIRVD